MKELLFLLPLLAIISCSDPDNPNRAKFNNSGCLECDNYLVGESFKFGGLNYTVADRIMLDVAILNGEDITRFCTSKITSMDNLLSNQVSFNQDIGAWDVSNVDDMKMMFKSAESFNQDVSKWDVQNVVDMSEMFFDAKNFDQPLDNWDVGSVNDMGSMFQGAINYNKNIGDWDVSRVGNMLNMFYNATLFNQDISGWCVPNLFVAPSGFSKYSALTLSNHPVWGTCP